MKLSELKEWVNKLPEELNEFPFVLREIKESEEQKFGFKDEPIMSIMVDKQSSRICIHGVEAQKMIDKIRETQPKQESDSVDPETTE